MKHNILHTLTAALLLLLSLFATSHASPANYTPFRIVNPCNKATDACATNYSKMLTANYQAGIAEYHIANPTDTCSLRSCAILKQDWQQRIQQGVLKREAKFDPGPRQWTNKVCKTVYFMGVPKVVCTGVSQ